MNMAVLHHTTDFFSLGCPKIICWLWASQKLCCGHSLGSLCPSQGTPGAKCALQGREQLLGVEPCWALNGSHLSAPSAAGHNSPDPSLSAGIWQPSTPAFHIFHHLQQQKESGGPGCSAKQRDKGYFPKLCNPVLHKQPELFSQWEYLKAILNYWVFKTN